MRKVILFLVILSLPGTLWAADPIIGTWKCTSPGHPDLKEEIHIYREVEGDMIELIANQILKDGSSKSFRTIWPKEGGIVKSLSEEFKEGRLYVELLDEPGNWYLFILRNGRQGTMYHKIVSEDGKTLTMIFKTTTSDGKQYNGKDVYKKVEN